MTPRSVSSGTVQPTVTLSRHVSQTCQPCDGARAWTVRASVHVTDVVLPDLSCDIILTDHRPRLLPRTVAMLSVELDPRSPIQGLRLPIAAADVRLDPHWSGWRQRRSGDPGEFWNEARTEGALAWTVDPARETLLRQLDTPGLQVSQVASALHLSERTLRRRSIEWFSATPVALRVVLRNWRYLRAVNAGQTATAAANAVGFADAAHASRELKRFTGPGAAAWTHLRLAE